MADNFNKPKNMSQLEESFEEHITRLGKQSKQARGTNLSRSSSAPQANNTNSSSRQVSSQAHTKRQTKNFNTPTLTQNVSLSPKAIAALDMYKDKGQHIQVLKVWSMLMQAFGSKFNYYFGDEPDVRFMEFAASLGQDSYKRLEANLLERLDEDKEWPPSLVRLRQLANSPTKETMYNARQRLFHHPVPINELNRVELYIKRFKMREVRHFSEKNFEAEFNRKYIQWFREVVLDDKDIEIEEKQREINDYLENQSPTDHDKLRDARIADRTAFNHKYGKKILEAIQHKKEHSEEISNEEAERIEQLRLAQKIQKSTGDC